MLITNCLGTPRPCNGSIMLQRVKIVGVIIIIIKTPQECRDEANALLVRVIQVWMFCPFCEAVSKRNVWKCEAMVMKIYDEVVC